MIKFEDLTKYRFKTEKELERDFGKDWRKELSWHSDKDSLFGINIESEYLGFYTHHQASSTLNRFKILGWYSLEINVNYAIFKEIITPINYIYTQIRQNRIKNILEAI